MKVTYLMSINLKIIFWYGVFGRIFDFYQEAAELKSQDVDSSFFCVKLSPWIKPYASQDLYL